MSGRFQDFAPLESSAETTSLIFQCQSYWWNMSTGSDSWMNVYMKLNYPFLNIQLYHMMDYVIITDFIAYKSRDQHTDLF